MNRQNFDYDQAFSRNLGWVTEAEQIRLRNATVAIGGMGGVGGHHLLALARMGVGNFRIADYDKFELVNFNRQTGATVDTINASKCDTMAAMVRAINPTAKIEVYRNGVSEALLDDFLKGADIYIDGIDFFAFDIREKIYATCSKLEVPAIIAIPLGYGGCLVMFHAGRNGFQNLLSVGKSLTPRKRITFFSRARPIFNASLFGRPQQSAFRTRCRAININGLLSLRRGCRN